VKAALHKAFVSRSEREKNCDKSASANLVQVRGVSDSGDVHTAADLSG